MQHPAVCRIVFLFFSLKFVRFFWLGLVCWISSQLALQLDQFQDSLICSDALEFTSIVEKCFIFNQSLNWWSLPTHTWSRVFSEPGSVIILTFRPGSALFKTLGCCSSCRRLTPSINVWLCDFLSLFQICCVCSSGSFWLTNNRLNFEYLTHGVCQSPIRILF